MDFSDFDNEQKRLYGESNAVGLITPMVFRVNVVKMDDDGIDVTAKGFDKNSFNPFISFQVKTGPSYKNGITIKSETLHKLVRSVDDTPIFFLHYAQLRGCNTPDYFLNFSNWLRLNIDRIGKTLESDQDLHIKHNVLSELNDDQNILWDCCREEIGLITGKSKSVLVNKYHPRFSSYHFYKYCNEVTQSWDLALLCGNNSKIATYVDFPIDAINQFQEYWDDSRKQTTLTQQLNLRNYHPIRRTPSHIIRKIHTKFIKALLDYDSGNAFNFPSKFDVRHTNVARSIASRFPKAIHPVIEVLRNWRNRSEDELLIAFQMSTTLSHFVRKHLRDSLLKMIENIVRSLDTSRIDSTSHFQILHHGYAAIGDILEDRQYTYRAIHLAKSNIKHELIHLTTYDWGVGGHVPAWYGKALQTDSSGNVARHYYNYNMRELLGDVILG